MCLPEGGYVLTWNENILVRCPSELHCFQGKDRHVLVNGIARDIFICTVVECNQDVQQDYLRS